MYAAESRRQHAEGLYWIVSMIFAVPPGFWNTFKAVAPCRTGTTNQVNGPWRRRRWPSGDDHSISVLRNKNGLAVEQPDGRQMKTRSQAGVGYIQLVTSNQFAVCNDKRPIFYFVFQSVT